MRFGCHLPVYGPAATRDTLVGFARRAEALGYDSLWASDHVVLPWRIASRYPYNATGDFPLPPATDFLEPLTALALVAGVTERAALGDTGQDRKSTHPNSSHVRSSYAVFCLNTMKPAKIAIDDV